MPKTVINRETYQGELNVGDHVDVYEDPFDATDYEATGVVTQVLCGPERENGLDEYHVMVRFLDDARAYFRRVFL